MIKVLSQIISVIFVIIGIAAPIGACYLMYTRKPQVDFYLGHVFGPNTFGQMTDLKRVRALEALDRRIGRTPPTSSPEPTRPIVQPAQ